MSDFTITILETSEQMAQVEALQRIVWPGSETDVIPAHLLLASGHNGALVIGAYAGEELVGVVFGFPALDFVPDGPVLKHHSHILAVLPEWRSRGVGFALKRAQWQMARKQGINRITWTYDPLMSRNANLNIANLGAVCSTYIRSYYGEMRDGLNVGLASDRFQVDWWLNTPRVERRLGKRARGNFGLMHFQQAGIYPLYETSLSGAGLLLPPEACPPLEKRLLLAEIPADFLTLKAGDKQIALDWRLFTREFFETAFSSGYIVTDFVYESGAGRPRSFYVLTHGDSTLDE